MATTGPHPGHRPPRRPPLDRHLLLAGSSSAGPMFFTLATIQMLTREGYDITRHPISQLSTGGLGGPRSPRSCSSTWAPWHWRAPAPSPRG